MGRSRSWPRLARSLLPALLIALFVVGLSSALAIRGAAAQGAVATVNIAIGDNTFVPQAVTVNIGDTVVWTNTGRVAHDVTALDGAFASPRRLAPGATFSYTATTAGTFAYTCTIHLNQDGALTVQGTAPAAAPRTGGGGMAQAGPLARPQLAALGALLALGAGVAVALRPRRAA